MRLRDVVRERSVMIELARASETAVGRAYAMVIQAKVAEVTRLMRKAPKMNSTDIKTDIRYQFGLLDGMEMVLRLQEEAFEEISKPESEMDGENE